MSSSKSITLLGFNITRQYRKNFSNSIYNSVIRSFNKITSDSPNSSINKTSYSQQKLVYLQKRFAVTSESWAHKEGGKVDEPVVTSDKPSEAVEFSEDVVKLQPEKIKQIVQSILELNVIEVNQLLNLLQVLLYMHCVLTSSSHSIHV